MGALVLGISLLLTRCSLANGAGDLHMKVSPFGKMLLHKNLGKKKRDGAQRQWGMIMGWLCGRLLEMGESFVSRTHFILGNRRRVKFWKDRWCGDSSLEVSFPSLYSLACDKDLSTRGVGTRRRGGLVEALLLEAFSWLGNWRSNDFSADPTEELD